MASDGTPSNLLPPLHQPFAVSPTLSSQLSPGSQFSSSNSDRASLNSLLPIDGPKSDSGQLSNTLTTDQLVSLIGKEYIQAAIFPAGVYRVAVLSSPVATLQYVDEAFPPVKTDRSQIGDAEERVLDIVPLESEDQNLIASTVEEKKGPEDSDKKQGGRDSSEGSASKDAKTEENREHQSLKEPTQITNETEMAEKTKKQNGEKLPSPLETPEPFSLLQCLNDPENAARPSKSKGFATCRLTFGTVEAAPQIKSRRNSRLNPSLISPSPSNRDEDLLLSLNRQTKSLSSNIYHESPNIDVSTKVFNDSSAFSSHNEKTISNQSHTTSGENSLLLFVVASLNDRAVYRTHVLPPSQSTSWNETVELQIHSPNSTITFELYDKEFQVDDGDPYEDECLAGATVRIQDLAYNETYTTSIEVNLSPRATIPLIAAARRVEQVLEAEADEDEVKIRSAVGNPSIQPQSNIDEFDPQLSCSIYVRVRIHVTLVPSHRYRYLATLGGYALPSLSILNAIAKDDLLVTATTVDVNRIRDSLFRLKHICLDSCAIPIHRRWNEIQAWHSIPQSATILAVFWVYLWFPQFSLPLFLGVLSALCVYVPKVLSDADTKSDGYKSQKPSTGTMVRLGNGERYQHSSDDFQQHPPSVAQPFLNTVLTDELLLTARKLEFNLGRYVCAAERIYKVMNDPSLSSARETAALVLGLFCAYSIVRPNIAAKIAGSMILIFAIMFFCATWSPIRILIRAVLATARSFSAWINYAKQSKTATSGMSLRTF